MWKNARPTSTGEKLPSRACERVESFISEFTNYDDVLTVRRLYAEKGDVDATMKLAVKLKVASQRAKEAA